MHCFCCVLFSLCNPYALFVLFRDFPVHSLCKLVLFGRSVVFFTLGQNLGNL